MIQALLLDFDGVLRSWDGQYDSHDVQASGVSAGAIGSVAFEPNLLLAAITGQISDEQWRAQIVAGLCSWYSKSAAEQAVRLWSASSGRIDPAVLELVRRCRRRVKVVLITNATSRLPHDLVRLGVSDVFDGVINSSQVGAAKPDARIYRAALESAGAVAQACLFVDDGPGHVAGAQRLGIAGHVYLGIEQFEAALVQYRLL